MVPNNRLQQDPGRRTLTTRGLSAARRLRGIITIALGSLMAFEAAAQEAPHPCGILRPPGQYGPYDYRTDRAKLPIVEDHHFMPSVEALIRGPTGGPVGAELDYTLRAFPNHHRALIATMRLGEKSLGKQPPGTKWPVECYFDRAVRFAPDDAVVRMLYAQFLGKHKRGAEATAQLEAAKSAAGSNGFTHYNIGLVYFELGDHEHALEQAWQASSLGFSRTELRQQLERAGKWRDAPG